MFRIGGSFAGVLASAEVAGSLAARWPSHAIVRALSDSVDVVAIVMTPTWRADVDELVGSTVLMEGFELLSASVIEMLSEHSHRGPVGYVERTWGFEIVDCAACWEHGKISAGPLGTAVTADGSNSALNEVLGALGIDRYHHPAVLRALADL